jgi:hypothetical protein|tara:strand:- start:245 stop:433 length:189 start_codon:yes stop_codon:yes gene_type:complete
MIRNKTSFLTAGSNGGIDDEYYIDEIIGIDELTYSDYHNINSRLENKLTDLEFGIQNVLVIL